MVSVTTSLKLDPELKARVAKIAAAQRRSAHWVMREAIERFTEQVEQEAQFDRQCEEAWEDYKTTGLHVAHSEVDAWLSKLAAGEAAPPPEPHL